MSNGDVTDFDRGHGYPHPCENCGYGWSIHRASDQLCPATRNGEAWSGAWEKNGAPGTRYTDRATLCIEIADTVLSLTEYKRLYDNALDLVRERERERDEARALAETWRGCWIERHEPRDDQEYDDLPWQQRAADKPGPIDYGTPYCHCTAFDGGCQGEKQAERGIMATTICRESFRPPPCSGDGCVSVAVTTRGLCVHHLQELHDANRGADSVEGR